MAPTGQDRPLLIFDGDCGFCTKSARWIEQRAAHRFDIAPAHSLDLEALGLTHDDVTTAAWWIEPGAHPRPGHDAIAASLRASALPWSFVGWVFQQPGVRTIGRWVYPVIARNRHRLPGATEACAVTPPRED